MYTENRKWPSHWPCSLGPNTHKVKVKVLVTQSCPTLCDPIDGSLPGPSGHGIFQARIPAWVAIFFSRGSSQPRDRTCISWVSYTTGRFFRTKPLGKLQKLLEECYVTLALCLTPTSPQCSLSSVSVNRLSKKISLKNWGTTSPNMFIQVSTICQALYLGI